MDKKIHRRPIVVTGFPYAYPYYFKVFEFFSKPGDLIFMLPRFWSAKNGTIQISLPTRPNFLQYGLGAWSYGGKSFLRGIFKGWMPGILFVLPGTRMKYDSRILYSCSEPHLLTTLFNGITAKLFGLKHILFTWQNIPPEDRMTGLKLRLSNTLVKLNLWLADGIICGNTKAELIIRNLSARIKTVVCPLSGVDTERFSPGPSSWKQNHGLRDAFVILFSGALDDRKGVESLLSAHVHLPVNAHVVIIGTGPKRQELGSLVESLGIAQRVHFFDWVKNEELPDIMRGADVFVYPSVSRGGWEEQFGYTMAEASACGLAVISTRSGSIEEVVRDGVTGILVPSGDSRSLADALLALFNDPERRARMGNAGRSYIAETFSHKAVAQTLERFLYSFI